MIGESTVHPTMKNSGSEEPPSEALDLQQSHFQASLGYDEHNTYYNFNKTNPEMPIWSKFLAIHVAKQGRGVLILKRYEVRMSNSFMGRAAYWIIGARISDKGCWGWGRAEVNRMLWAEHRGLRDWEVYVVNAPYHKILTARWSMNGNVDFAILCALEIAKGNRIAQDERKRRQWESRKRHSGCSIKCTF
jgi:hypothetical protein